MKFKGKAVLLFVLNFLLTYLPFIDHIRVGPSFVDGDDCKSYVFLRECLPTSSQCPPQSMSLSLRLRKSRSLLVKRKLTVSSMAGQQECFYHGTSFHLTSCFRIGLTA